MADKSINKKMKFLKVIENYKMFMPCELCWWRLLCWEKPKHHQFDIFFEPAIAQNQTHWNQEPFISIWRQKLVDWSLRKPAVEGIGTKNRSEGYL